MVTKLFRSEILDFRARRGRRAKRWLGKMGGKLGRKNGWIFLRYQEEVSHFFCWDSSPAGSEWQREMVAKLFRSEILDFRARRGRRAKCFEAVAQLRRKAFCEVWRWRSRKDKIVAGIVLQPSLTIWKEFFKLKFQKGINILWQSAWICPWFRRAKH